MSKAQKIWDAAHPVKIGQILKPGTEFIRMDTQDQYGWVEEISIHRVKEDGLLEIVGTYMERCVRTVEQQDDRIDTGTLGFQLLFDDKIEIRTHFRGASRKFTRTQARNFAHQILEALDD